MSVQDGQSKRQREENAGQPGGELHQHIGGLCAENIFRNSAAECRTEAFAFWTLHQDHEDHEQRYEHEKRQEEIN